VKRSPKVRPNPVSANIGARLSQWEKATQNLATSVTFEKKWPEANSRPTCENSPNPVTLKAAQKPQRVGSNRRKPATSQQLLSLTHPMVASRVTRGVCEKVAQNVAQPIFCENQ
jgi:hypothetical protein